MNSLSSYEKRFKRYRNVQSKKHLHGTFCCIDSALGLEYKAAYGLISMSEIQGKASSQFLEEEGPFNFHFRFHSWSLPDG